MRRVILAAAILLTGFLTFGSTAYANPAKVWVINGNVADALNGGPVDFTALTDANVGNFDAWQTASAGQISSDPIHAGTVYIVVQTDGSATPVSLNGRGLTCASVIGDPLGVACDGSATDTPTTVGSSGQFVVWEVTNVGTFTGNATVTAVQDAVTLDSNTLALVGQATNVTLAASKTAIQEGARACPLAASQSSPTNGAAVMTYTDINGNDLVGYSPTFSTSATGTMVVGNTAGTLTGGASQATVSMLQSDGATIGAADSYCGVAAGSATLSATTIAGEIAGISTAVSRTQAISVGGAPASITLTASPATIVCDGTQTSTVTAKVTDSAGNNVVDGTNVNFSVVALGTANPINVATTDGSASSTITPLSAAIAGVTVIVTSGNAQSSILINCAQPTPTPTSVPCPPRRPSPPGHLSKPDRLSPPRGLSRPGALSPPGQACRGLHASG